MFSQGSVSSPQLTQEWKVKALGMAWHVFHGCSLLHPIWPHLFLFSASVTQCPSAWLPNGQRTWTHLPWSVCPLCLSLQLHEIRPVLQVFTQISQWPWPPMWHVPHPYFQHSRPPISCLNFFFIFSICLLIFNMLFTSLLYCILYSFPISPTRM